MTTKQYAAAARGLSAETLRREVQGLKDKYPRLASAAASELARRGQPLDQKCALPPAAEGFTFSPPADSTTPGRSGIELWTGGRHAATIYATRSGIHLTCEAGWAAGHLEIEHNAGGLTAELRSTEQ